MTDEKADPATRDRPGTPTWVKVLGTAIVVVILAIIVVSVVGGGQHGPGLHTPGGTNGPASSSSGSAPAGEVGERADGGDATRTIEVRTLDTMAFEPSAIDVAAGETVTFAVTNSGQAVHELTLGDAAMQQEHAAAMAHMPAGIAHVLDNSITLQPGESSKLTWRFGAAGRLEYACHEAGHYEAGMRGRIIVG